MYPMYCLLIHSVIDLVKWIKENIDTTKLDKYAISHVKLGNMMLYPDSLA